MSAIDGEAFLLPTIAVNGVHAVGTTATVKAAAVAASTYAYTFTKPYSHTLNGKLATYRAGSTYILDLATKTLLLGLSAPMVAA